MAAVKAPFKQADVTRALKGAFAAGLDPRAFRLSIKRDGEICIAATDGAPSTNDDRPNSVDAILNGQAH